MKIEIKIIINKEGKTKPLFLLIRTLFLLWLKQIKLELVYYLEIFYSLCKITLQTTESSKWSKTKSWSRMATNSIILIPTAQLTIAPSPQIKPQKSFSKNRKMISWLWTCHLQANLIFLINSSRIIFKKATLSNSKAHLSSPIPTLVLVLKDFLPSFLMKITWTNKTFTMLANL